MRRRLAARVDKKDPTPGDLCTLRSGYTVVSPLLAKDAPQGGARPLVSDMATEEDMQVESALLFGSGLPEPDHGHPLSERERVAAALFGRPGATKAVGRYQVDRVLGEGATGVVYEGRDDGLDRTVALKLIRKDVWDGGHAELRFRREAQALARLSHPNVVAIHEIGEHEGQLFIAMELVRGQTLREWLAEGTTRSWRESTEVFLQAGRGLEAAHQAGLVHRDFKPANCLVGEDGRVRVLDFGLARGTASDKTLDSVSSSTPSGEVVDATVTATGVLLGTPAYMAPEQLLAQSVTAASDQFSFGVALYEALVGVRPFSGASTSALYESIAAESIREGNGQAKVPAGLLGLVRRSLHLDPSRRWPDMKTFLDALERFPVQQRRRRSGLVGGGLATVGVVAALVFGVEDPCAAADSLSAPGWSDAERERVKEAIDAAKVDTETVWRTADAAIGAWAEEWRIHRSSTCHAALTDGRTTESIYDRQVVCLDRHGRTAAALIGGLHDDAEAWLHLPRVIRALPTLEHCTDPEHVLAVDPPEPSISEAVGDVRAKIDASLSAWTRGRGTEAEKLSEEARLASAQLDYPLLRAEVGLLRAVILENTLESDREELLLSAWSDAELAGADLTAADTATRLVGAALVSGHALSAKRWLVLAEAKVARARGGALREAKLARAAAELARATGDAAAADAHSRRALDLTETAVGTEGFEFANALGYRALSLELRRPGPQVLAAHDRAVEAARAATGLHPLLANAVLNRGGYKLDTGAFQDAVVDFDLALSILQDARLEESALLKTRLLRLQALSMTGDLDLERVQDAVAPLEQLPDGHPARLEAMAVYASVLQRLGHHDEALAEYDRLIEVHAEQPETPGEELAMLESNAAECLLGLGRLPVAKRRFDLALGALERTLGPDDPRRAYPLTGLGNVALLQGEAALAQQYFERALPLALENAGDLVTLTSVQWGLARALRLQGREGDRAESLARDAAKNLQSLGAEGFETLREVEEWLGIEPSIDTESEHNTTTEHERND